MSPVTERAGNILHWLKGLVRAGLHCHWPLSDSVTGVMTSSPLREEQERERKTVCSHQSMSISNYSSTNHQPGSIGSGWVGGWIRGLDGRREEGSVCKCLQKDRRITDQYQRMDFVILQKAVSGWLTPTCSELLPASAAVDDTSVHHSTPTSSFFISALCTTIAHLLWSKTVLILIAILSFSLLTQQ